MYVVVVLVLGQQCCHSTNDTRAIGAAIVTSLGHTTFFVNIYEMM